MAKPIITDSPKDELDAQIAAENHAESVGFSGFSWLHAEAISRHGSSMSSAFDLARSLLHGNATLLEILEDQDFGRTDQNFGVGRKGDLMRFLVTANQLAAARMAELCDDINTEALESQDAPLHQP